MTTFYEPVHLEIGPDSIQQLPDLIRKYGKKVLLVHGHHPVENGLLETVRNCLNEAGIPHANMGQILPNPKYSSVKRGIEIAKEEKCDLILSLGGGSTLQCAKGIAIGLKNDGHLWDYWTGKETVKKAAPVAAVLTNPASGDELNDACTLVKDGEQKTLNTPACICSFAILDPNLAVVSFYPTMCECFIMFTMLFGRYLANDGITASMDLQMMKELMESTQALEKDLNNLQAQTSLFWISALSHSLHQERDPQLPQLADRVAFHHSLARGAALSALFPAWVKAQMEKSPEKFSKLGSVLFDLPAAGEPQASLDALLRLIAQMKLPASLKEAGLELDADELKKLAQNKADAALLKASL